MAAVPIEQGEVVDSIDEFTRSSSAAPLHRLRVRVKLCGGDRMRAEDLTQETGSRSSAN